MNVLSNEIRQYWTDRSGGYSKVNQEELACLQKEKWLKAIKNRIDVEKKDVCKILDVGTGPGFFSIILAEDGFNVTAIDFTEAMLKEAKENAGALADKIDFKQMDAQKLIFEDETFDVVISRNLTWNLQSPHAAYSEWVRVLKKGGVMLNFDANWYCYIDDEEKRKQYELDREKTAAENVVDLYEGTDIEAMEDIARRLPLSKTLRPNWDIERLSTLNVSSINIEENVWKEVWSYEEKINGNSTPMFLIKAIK